MQTSTTEKLVLQKPPQEIKPALFMALLLPFLSPLMFIFMFWMHKGGEKNLGQLLFKGDVAITVLFIGLFGFIALFTMFFSIIILYQAYAFFRERIVVDEEGIHYQSNLPTQLQGWQFINLYNLPIYQKDWSVTWSALKKVYIRKPRVNAIPGSKLLILELDMGLERHDILLCQWTNTQNPTITPCTPPNIKPWQVENNAENREWLRQHPLAQAITQHGVTLEIEKDIDLSTPFYAASNPYSITTFGLFGALVVFALFGNMDLFGLEEIYTGKPFFVLNLTVGGIVALLFSLWPLRAKIPVAHSFFAGLMVGGALFVAMSPGLLLLNYFTDKEGLKTYQYQHQQDGMFTPVDPALPPIRLGRSKYWQQFPADTLHEFELRRGGLGFYQLYIAPIEKKIREYEKESKS